MTLDIRLNEYVSRINSQPMFTEIIAYSPDLEKEAPRLYVSSQKVYRKIGAVERPLNGVCPEGALLQDSEYAREMVAKYIVNRISIRSGEDLTIALVPLAADLLEDSGAFDIEIEKPFDFVEPISPHRATGSSESTQRHSDTRYLDLKFIYQS